MKRILAKTLMISGMIMVISGISACNNVSNTTPSENRVVYTPEENTISYCCLADYYDYDNDISLQNGMRTIVNDTEEEKLFLSYFFDDTEEQEIIVDNKVTLYLQKENNKETSVFFISQENNEYPKCAYGFICNTDDFVAVATYDDSKSGTEVFDEINSLDEDKFDVKSFITPLQAYQETDYVEEENKVVYSSDANIYGTYNSSGELYYDENNRPLYKEYYTTGGTRISYYLYDSNGKLSQVYDFGGMAYKGLENDPEIEIGIDLKTCIFE